VGPDGDTENLTPESYQSLVPDALQQAGIPTRLEEGSTSAMKIIRLL